MLLFLLLSLLLFPIRPFWLVTLITLITLFLFNLLYLYSPPLSFPVISNKDLCLRIFKWSFSPFSIFKDYIQCILLFLRLGSICYSLMLILLFGLLLDVHFLFFFDPHFALFLWSKQVGIELFFLQQIFIPSKKKMILIITYPQILLILLNSLHCKFILLFKFNMKRSSKVSIILFTYIIVGLRIIKFYINQRLKKIHRFYSLITYLNI